MRGFVDTYCVSCHNARMKTAGLVLEGRDFAAIGHDAEVWEKVATKMLARAMPPPRSAQPDKATYASFITALEAQLDQIGRAHV